MADHSANKLDIIQVLRGLAATAVMLWHASIFLGPYDTGPGAALFYPLATMGVDLFFLICGFVMYITTIRTVNGTTFTQQPAVFLIKRLTRIYPLYLLCTLGIFAIEWSGERQTQDLLMRSLLFLPVYNDQFPNVFAPTMTIGWSITYEVFFYLLFAAALCFRRNFLQILLFWAVVAIMAPIAMGHPPASQTYGIFAILGSDLNLLFLAGILIGALYRSSFRLSRNGAVAAAILAPLPAMYQYLTQTGLSHGFEGVGLSMALLFLLLIMADKTLDIRCSRPLTYLGDISYSIYLTHPLAMWAMMYSNEKFAFGNPYGGCANIAAILMLTLGISIVTHQLIERRLSARLRDLLLSAYFGFQHKAVTGRSRN